MHKQPDTTRNEPPNTQVPLLESQKNESMYTVLRKNIEQARVQKELNLCEFSELSGIDVNTLRDYERGTQFPRAEHVSQLEKHLGITLAPSSSS